MLEAVYDSLLMKLPNLNENVFSGGGSRVACCGWKEAFGLLERLSQKSE